MGVGEKPVQMPFYALTPHDYGTEDQCKQALEQWHWPQGFICTSCGHADEPVRLRMRALLQCRHCHHQTSLIAGTIFEATKLVTSQ